MTSRSGITISVLATAALLAAPALAETPVATATFKCQGGKSIDIQDISATTRVNGSGSGSSLTPPTRRVSRGQRVLVGELSGTWADGTSSWSTLVSITTNEGESLRASVIWK